VGGKARVPRGEPFVERFAKTTRWFHWTFALSFLTLAASGAALAVRELLGLGPAGAAAALRVHQGAAVALLTAPALVVLSGQTRAALGDLREILRWSRDDLRWLALQPGAWLRGAELPPAGKLNAGQKLNGLASALCGAGLAASGLLLWARPGSLGALAVHLVLVLAWLPFFAVHLGMATLVPSTRHALRGMLSGRVRRSWAAHHHPRWLRELERDPPRDG
jgi:formate dehydrogenase subunit gamma